MDRNALVTGNQPALLFGYRAVLGALGYQVESLPLEVAPSKPFSVAVIDARREVALPRLRMLAGRGLLLAVAPRGQEVYMFRNGADEVVPEEPPSPGLLAVALSGAAQRLGRPVDGALGTIIGRAPAMQRVLLQIERYADSGATVLLRGETGTGKEVFARAIHERSPRQRGPFVALNCAAIPETLIEAELFGHARGAFTGAMQNRQGSVAAAEGGTLFLDEVSELAQAAQAKLLRVLQEREYTPVGQNVVHRADVRVVAATNRRLEDEVTSGRFRADLYWRLEVITIELPPLRERIADVLALGHHFIDRTNNQHQRAVSGISLPAQALLQEHSWPGNVRELENTVERAVILRGDGLLMPEDIVLRRPLPPPLLEGIRLPPDGLNLCETTAALEMLLIDQALAQTGGNRTQAARLLKINRTTLHDKLKLRRGGLRT